MTNIEKQQIVSILDKDKISMYEVSQLVEFLAKAFNTAEGPGRFTELSEQLNNDVRCAVDSVKHLSKKLLELYNDIANAQEAAYADTEERFSKLYGKYESVVKKVKQDIANLGTIEFPNVNMPYNWKEVLEMSERLSSMTKEQREVFYELIDKYSKK